MSTYYSPGCNNEQAHVCDNCEKDDGRQTLYWKDKGFDLCHECLESLFIEFIDPVLKSVEILQPTRKSVPEKVRNRIFERDGHRCKLCGSDKDLEVDHIIPFSRGGKTEESNFQTLCKPCNLAKRDK